MFRLFFICMLFPITAFGEVQESFISTNRGSIQTIHYDSLYNIGDLNETESSIKKYIGQEILFLNRVNPNVPQYYANFDYEKPIVVDTIWFKIRKNKKKIKPDDYELISTTSYNPVYVKNEIVVLAGAGVYHYGKKTERDLFSYKEENGSIRNPQRIGYFTHYKSVEGKYFKILDIKKEDVGSTFESFIFKLQSDDNQVVYWTAECNTMKYKKIAYPVVIKSYLDKIKSLYLRSDFYFKSSDYEGSKYFCSDLVFRPEDGGYYAPYMKLDDKYSDTRYLRLISTPKLFDSEIYANQGLRLDNTLLVKAENFESEKEQYKKEQNAIAEQIEKEKKQREIDIKKKHGNHYGKLILERKVKIGMNKLMVIDSWGNPSDINRTIGSYGVHEQWCYDGAYLYFENGKLTTIQD